MSPGKIGINLKEEVFVCLIVPDQCCGGLCNLYLNQCRCFCTFHVFHIFPVKSNIHVEEYSNLRNLPEILSLAW